MADGNIKDLVRTPFANYDIVVYFGGGLFSIPFLRHYVLVPFDMRFPHMSFEIETPYIGEVVFALTLLFSVYIAGHIIAYLGSQLIEKTIQSWFGKPSAIILAECDALDRTKAIFEEFSKNIKKVRKESPVIGAIRLFYHLPAILVYTIMYSFGTVGFFRSRVPTPVMLSAKSKLISLNIGGAEIKEGKDWYKIVEGCVINNHPIATTRMYNYLVISGLFRSLSLIFLTSMWMEIAFIIFRVFGGPVIIGAIMTDSTSLMASLWTFGFLSIVYAFVLASHLKFSRRYVEEAIFSFVLTKNN